MRFGAFTLDRFLSVDLSTQIGVPSTLLACKWGVQHAFSGGLWDGVSACVF